MFLNKWFIKNILKCGQTITHYSSKTIQETVLHDFHLRNGAKMMNFANFKLPLVYKDLSIIESHKFTRQFASIFDVSHMLQTSITGSQSVNFIENVCPANCKGMRNDHCCYSMFLDENTGGIIDDFILIKVNNESFIVISNASRSEFVQEFLQKKSVELNVFLRFYNVKETSLIAIQGPKSSQCMQKFISYDLSNISFMQSRLDVIADIPNCRITRCGYTGEDGFEIIVDASSTKHLVTELIKANKDNVKLAGLAVRDSLRLEAGLCLYGADINEKINPVEAGLSWAISKKRHKLGNYPGFKFINSSMISGVEMQRVGILFEKKGPIARINHKIFDDNCVEIGYITSGTYSPILDTNIAMGYILKKYIDHESHLKIEIRGEMYSGYVHSLPFVKTKYYFSKPQSK